MLILMIHGEKYIFKQTKICYLEIIILQQYQCSSRAHRNPPDNNYSNNLK